jgi:HlyD family secretion protein
LNWLFFALARWQKPKAKETERIIVGVVMRTVDTHDSGSTDARAQQSIPISPALSSAPDLTAEEIIDRSNTQISPSPSKSKSITISLVAVALSAAIGFACFQMNNANSNKNNLSGGATPPAVTVSTTTVKTQRVDDSVSVTGSVSAWDPLSIGAEAGGMRITTVSVEEGDVVRKGQILATLNSSVLRSQLAQAKAKLASAEATAKKSIQPNRPDEINALKDLLSQNASEIHQEEALKKEAKITLENNLVNAKRWTALASSGVVSNVDAETKNIAAETAREELSSADAKLSALRAISAQTRDKLKQAQIGGRTEDVDIARATVEEMKGRIEELEHQIEQTFIRSPDDGVISKRDAHIGSITSVGTPLFSIIRLNRLELQAQVADIDLAKFKVGQLVKISVNEDDEGKIAGRVTLVSPVVDQASRLGIVRVTLPANAGLKPGMFVRGQVDMGHRNALTVPSAAVITRTGESFVFTLDGKRAVATPVKVGVRTDKFAEISDGVKNGEVVVNAGARFLSDHDVVRVEK